MTDIEILVDHHVQKLHSLINRALAIGAGIGYVIGFATALLVAWLLWG